jgi:hypothetical protein
MATVWRLRVARSLRHRADTLRARAGALAHSACPASCFRAGESGGRVRVASSSAFAAVMMGVKSGDIE